MTPNIEDVLKKHITPQGYDIKINNEIIKAAMKEWASLNRQGWTRVEDGLPEVDERVLICYGGEVCIAFHDGENWGDTDEYFLGEITHWMKLPEPPKQNI